MATTDRFLGVDAAGKHGWLGVLVDANGYLAARTGYLADIIAWAEPVAAVAVDIPIGNIPGGGRRADDEARRFVGRLRASSVFPAPPLEVIEAASYLEANEILARMVSPRLSKQAWALIPKIGEAAIVAAADARVVEVHPEVSFRELAREPITWSKKSWNGLLFRRQLLGTVGIELPDVIPDLENVAPDDVVDASVAGWSARRIASRAARSFPDPPEASGDRHVAIWC